MSRKIQISIAELEKFYLQEKKSTYKIGMIFRCDASVIQKRLKAHGIPLRSPKKKIIVSKELLKQLYLEEGLSTYKIAKKLSIGRMTIWSNLNRILLN